MVDILKHPLITQAYEVCHAIEECGASEKLTAAVVKASALMYAIDAHFEAIESEKRALGELRGR
jgi:hypothetical protein